MGAHLEFLSCKYNIEKKQLRISDLLKIAEKEHITVIESDLLDSKNVPYKALLYYGEGLKLANHPILFVGKKAHPEENEPAFWFKLAHEIGHFFLHPYHTHRLGPPTPILRKSKSEEHDHFSEEDLKRLRGISDKEADQFATIIFIPTKELDKKFSLRVLNALLKKKSKYKTRHESLEVIREDIFEYLRTKTKNLLINDVERKKRQTSRIKNYTEDISLSILTGELHPDPVRNLKIRVNDYVKMIEEKFVIVLGEYPDLISDGYLDEFIKINKINDLNKLFKIINDAYYHYNEIWENPYEEQVKYWANLMNPLFPKNANIGSCESEEEYPNFCLNVSWTIDSVPKKYSQAIQIIIKRDIIEDYFSERAETRADIDNRLIEFIKKKLSKFKQRQDKKSRQDKPPEKWIVPSSVLHEDYR